MDLNAERRPSSSKPAPTVQYSSKSELMSLSFLCITTLISTIRAHDYPFKIPYGVNLCLLAMLLLMCLDVFQRLPENSHKQEKLKIPLYILTNIINFSYIYEISDLLSPTMRWVMWASAWGTLIFGFFYTFFPLPPTTKDKDKSDVNTSLSVEV